MYSRFLRISGYIVNALAFCIGAWFIYVMVMAILNTFGLLNI